MKKKSKISLKNSSKRENKLLGEKYGKNHNFFNKKYYFFIHKSYHKSNKSI